MGKGQSSEVKGNPESIVLCSPVFPSPHRSVDAPRAPGWGGGVPRSYLNSCFNINSTNNGWCTGKFSYLERLPEFEFLPRRGEISCFHLRACPDSPLAKPEHTRRRPVKPKLRLKHQPTDKETILLENQPAESPSAGTVPHTTFAAR